MVEHAATQSRFTPATALYPGIQAPIPTPYPLFAHFFTRAMIPEVFGLGDRDVIDSRCTFSIVTNAAGQGRRPAAHSPYRLPRPEPHRAAALSV